MKTPFCGPDPYTIAHSSECIATTNSRNHKSVYISLIYMMVMVTVTMTMTMMTMTMMAMTTMTMTTMMMMMVMMIVAVAVTMAMMVMNQESGKLYWAQWPVTLNIHSTECM